MRAGLMIAVDEFVVEDVTALDPGPKDVVVQVGASGVCHSDVSVLKGDARMPPPVVLGHEGAGTVEWVGTEVSRVKVGDRVIASLGPVCGACWHCRRNETHLCEAALSVSRNRRVARADGDEFDLPRRARHVRRGDDRERVVARSRADRPPGRAARPHRLRGHHRIWVRCSTPPTWIRATPSR